MNTTVSLLLTLSALGLIYGIRTAFDPDPVTARGRSWVAVIFFGLLPGFILGRLLFHPKLRNRLWVEWQARKRDGPSPFPQMRKLNSPMYELTNCEMKAYEGKLAEFIHEAEYADLSELPEGFNSLPFDDDLSSCVPYLEYEDKD